MTREMTVSELVKNGNERESALIGNWRGPQGLFTIAMVQDVEANIMRLVFRVARLNDGTVVNAEQELDVSGQLRVERAIKEGLFVKL